MDFRETLLAAQRNQQQKSSDNTYYKARFDPPKKEQKQKDRLSANIQKFLAKKDEEERQKKLDAQKKRDELLAMRDPKAIRKIQKSLKVFKSANKSVIEDAVDRDNTAVTREGPIQPDQDDYGYESQEAAALYEKMMKKYSKIPDEPKFPTNSTNVKKDLNGTRERVKNALQHEDDPVPHKRKRKGTLEEKEPTPPPCNDTEKKKPDKSKIRRPLPPPMDFNQLLKLAEQKKAQPLEITIKKSVADSEPERLMTKKQRKEYEEEMARRQRRQERLEADKGGGRKQERPIEKDKKTDLSLGRIPKIGDKSRNDIPKVFDRENTSDKERVVRLQKDKAKLDRERIEREKEKLDRERLEKLKAERERIDRELERLNKEKLTSERDRIDRELEKLSKLDRSKIKSEKTKIVDKYTIDSREQSIKKNIDLKIQNTYRIDKKLNKKKLAIPNKNTEKKYINGHSSQGKHVPKPCGSHKLDGKEKLILTKQKTLFGDRSEKLNGQNSKQYSESSKPKRSEDRKMSDIKPQLTSNKAKITNSFDFDKHVNSLGKNKPKPNGLQRPERKNLSEEMRKKQKGRTIDSESEYDSEMDDFIDDGDENLDYSRHIKEIFGYDKSKYRDMDDEDDPTMESSFARQQREEYISKKIGIMEDLEDMRMEAMEKKKSNKRRRISDD